MQIYIHAYHATTVPRVAAGLLGLVFEKNVAGLAQKAALPPTNVQTATVNVTATKLNKKDGEDEDDEEDEDEADGAIGDGPEDDVDENAEPAPTFPRRLDGSTSGFKSVW